VIHIIGQGKWGKRLTREYKNQVFKTWTHGEHGYKINEGSEVIVAIPAPYLIEVLYKFDVDPQILITSATKGLDIYGSLPSQTIRRLWNSIEVRVMGGACISTEPTLDIQYGGEELEIAGILKNVYAIGFSYSQVKYGDNVTAVWFVKVWKELRGLVGKEEYLSDLAVTSISSKSRNNKVGQLIARGEPIDLGGQIAEGVHSAKMIEKFDLFSNLYLLRETTNMICEYLK
jgi:glycerol-3-phosphate dehydrogenase